MRPNPHPTPNPVEIWMKKGLINGEKIFSKNDLPIVMISWSTFCA